MPIAPTGAVSCLLIKYLCKMITRANKGKTDVAMLSILRVLDQHRSIVAPGSPLRVSINRDSFKIIYVSVQMISSSQMHS